MAKHTKKPKHHHIWFGALSVLIGLLLLRLAAPAWAAPTASRVHQTVPLPTATPAPPAFPTATPATAASDPDEDDDDDEDDEDDPADSDESAGEAGAEDVEYGVSFEEPTPTPTGAASTGADPANDNADNNAATDATNADSGQATQQAPAGAEAGTDAVVETNYTATANQLILNLRKEPHPEAAVLGTVFQDDVLRIVGHNGERSWWFVCCVFGREAPGWVDASLITLQDPDLVLADDSIPQLLETTESTTAAAAAQNPSSLQLALHHEPPFVWQGEPVTMTLVVTNTGESDALAVELRDEFAPELEVLASDGDSAGVVEQEFTRQGATILTAQWPELAPGAVVTLRVTLQIADEVADGAVIDNLAVVDAANATAVTAGLTIGMPPTTLPDFR